MSDHDTNDGFAPVVQRCAYCGSPTFETFCQRCCESDHWQEHWDYCRELESMSPDDRVAVTERRETKP